MIGFFRSSTKAWIFFLVFRFYFQLFFHRSYFQPFCQIIEGIVNGVEYQEYIQ
jgi:hypothetical protein